MAKNLEIPFLLDFYGEMLTEKQRNCLCLLLWRGSLTFRNCRKRGYKSSSVRDSIKRAEAQLFDMEKRLGLAKRFTEMKKGVDEIVECADKINEYNLNHTLSMEVNDNVARIKTLASFLKEG